MNQKYACEECNNKLEEDIYGIPIDILGFKYGYYNKKFVIICVDCYEEFRDKLKDDENWGLLLELDNGLEQYFQTIKELKEWLEK